MIYRYTKSLVLASSLFSCVMLVGCAGNGNSTEQACSMVQQAFSDGTLPDASMKSLADAYRFFIKESASNPSYALYAEGANAAYGLTPKYILTSSMYSTVKAGGGAYMSSEDAYRIDSLLRFCGF